jgi:hypothetical protein
MLILNYESGTGRPGFFYYGSVRVLLEFFESILPNPVGSVADPDP